jgi:hypothetical protein
MLLRDGAPVPYDFLRRQVIDRDQPEVISRFD